MANDELFDPDAPTPEEGLARFHERLPECFELFDLFRESEGPVQQADALLQFANAFWGLRRAAEDAGLVPREE